MYSYLHVHKNPGNLLFTLIGYLLAGFYIDILMFVQTHCKIPIPLMVLLVVGTTVGKFKTRKIKLVFSVGNCRK